MDHRHSSASEYYASGDARLIERRGKVIRTASESEKPVVLVGSEFLSEAQLTWVKSRGKYCVPKEGAKRFADRIDSIGSVIVLDASKQPHYFTTKSCDEVDRDDLVAFECPEVQASKSGQYFCFNLSRELKSLPRQFKSAKRRQYLIDFVKLFSTDMEKAVLTHAIREAATGENGPHCKQLEEIAPKPIADAIREDPIGAGVNLAQMDLFGEQPPFPPPTKPQFKFIDLFAGIGGFRIAMQNCGGKCVFTSEFDPYAQKTYQANFGEFPFGDITKQETHDKIPAEFDIVCAGFPCQAFSLAGKRLGFNDNFKGMSRGTLFAEVVKICEKHQPKAVFCENVKGLAIHDKGNTFKVIKGEFEKINTDVFGQTLPGKHSYRFFHKVLNSKDFGVPQNRERIYMVALRDDYAPEGYEFEFPEGDKEKVTLESIREHDVPARYYLSDVYMDTLIRHRARHEAAGHGFGYEIRKWDGIAGAIVCGGMGRERNLVQEEGGTPAGLVPETHIKGHINKDGIRKMTPREWARLQGFPEDYKFVLSDVHLYKQFGNSVSIPAIQAISKAIVDRIEEVDAKKRK